MQHRGQQQKVQITMGRQQQPQTEIAASRVGRQTLCPPHSMQPISSPCLTPCYLTAANAAALPSPFAPVLNQDTHGLSLLLFCLCRSRPSTRQEPSESPQPAGVGWNSHSA